MNNKQCTYNLVMPYIETMGCDRYKKFIMQPFSIDMLNSNDDAIPTYFDGWRRKNMGTWEKLTNDDNIILEFYPNQYNIIIPKANKITISLPLTINDFINDMQKYNVQLYWSTWMDENFEPKEYLNQNQIREYFVDLLNKMDKSYELLYV